jgi:NhaA family Na+:H+ antiporter
MSQSSENGQDSVFQRFLHWEAAGSLVLLASAVVALVWANSPWAESYDHLTHTYLSFSIGEDTFKLSLKHWVNDLLMVVFFFVVGLEIKREMVLGQLSSFSKAILPVMAAVGGMLVPAGIYLMFNAGGPGQNGWGIPMATDIAFALGILALFGTRAPLGLKVFLTALAIADDMGAVLVIALFYTEEVRLLPLLIAAGCLVLISLAAQARVKRVGIYAALILVVWLGVFASGVHATIAGILLALVVPVRAQIDPKNFFDTAKRSLATLEASEVTKDSMVDNDDEFRALTDLSDATAGMLPPGVVLERYLHIGQAFIVLPLFAFFNAGVHIGGDLFAILKSPISLGVILGLVLGKQIGVLFFSWLIIKSGKASLPAGVTWAQIWGVSCLAGIGFTMSIFVDELAFNDPAIIDEAKVGILAASLIAGILGYIVLKMVLPPKASN